MKPYAGTVAAVVLLLLSTAGGVPPRGRFVEAVGENQLDKLIDEIIYEQGQELIKKGKDKIRLPDFHKKFEKHIVGSLELEAEVHLENGWFKNTTTLYRIGDVEEKDAPDGSMTFRATFGLRTAVIGHEDFNWKFWMLQGSGDMDAECKDNAVTVQFTIAYDEQHNCKVNLDVAQITRLGSFRVSFEPDGFVNKLKGKLFTCALNVFASRIKDTVNAHLEDALRAALKKVDICGMLPF
ncbi:hypothetical protein AAG570_002414 [Ranatra chinensis]|uniref:Uncharacterized protein n=1 Tax=Ranatra chinensis TaxID=642074 RepID=A0ABD0YVV6_9HEMI